MARYRVVVTDQAFPDVETERALLAAVDAELVVAGGDPEALPAAAADADALLNTYMPVDAGAIAELPRCRIIARYGIGVDNIDLDAARAAGVAVTNVPDYCVEEVAVHTLALLLALQRRIVEADSLTRAGGWGVESLGPVQRLSQRTVGLVGYGRIARRLAEMLRPLGVTVLAADPYVTGDELGGASIVDLDILLERSDVVSLHCPLTPGTRGMIARPQLERMRADAILVNCSRGPLVVLADLLESLRDGTIAGAALDVFEREPVDPALLEGVPNLLVTPHVAFYSQAAIKESQVKAATQVRKALLGEQLDYRVN